jgi:hypothetical protein
LSDNVIQGKQVFVHDIQREMSNVTKMNTEQEGQTSFVKSSKNSDISYLALGGVVFTLSNSLSLS